MRRPESVAQIVGAGLCTGCGLCESIAGNQIPMAMNRQGFLRPAVPDCPDKETERAILAVCPGINQTGSSHCGRHPLWGPYEGLFIGHTTDAHIRHVASSAGIATSAAAFMLESGQAELVLHVSADPHQPVRSVAKVSRTPAEVLAGTGARYGPAAPLQLLHQILAAGQRFVVLAKPCDIAAVRNLARLDERVDRLLVATISFLCAGVPSHAVTSALVEKYSIAESDVRNLRYRGYGCPGPTHIETRDGRVFEQTYAETWSSELSQGVQFRCKICPDSTGEQADLVCGDAWEGADGYPEESDGEGFNSIIARTGTGSRILADLVGTGRVAVQPIDVSRLTAMQAHHGRRKSVVLARLAGFALAGQPMPRFRKLGLARAAILGARHALSNIRGMMRRVRNGKNREDMPLHPRAVQAGLAAPSGPE